VGGVNMWRAARRIGGRGPCLRGLADYLIG
jgi:hypothetical protein